MSDGPSIRLWLGWRQSALVSAADGWQRFITQLAHRFIPDTWNVMTRHHLLSYTPSILMNQSEAQLPDEVALLVYRSRADYDARTSDPQALAYGKSHSVLFDMRKSLSDWVGGPKARSSAVRPAAAGAPGLLHADARLHVLLLTHADTPVIGCDALLAALPATDVGEAVVWCRRGFSLVWLAANRPLDCNALAAPLAERLGARLQTLQLAQTAPSVAPGQALLPVKDDQSWRFLAASSADAIAAEPTVAGPSSVGAALRPALKAFLRDWPDDLPAAWRPLLSDVALDWDAVTPGLRLDEARDRIFPSRRGQLLAGAPADSHLFRTLDDLAPDEVRAVLIGQDPYPDIGKATGRSFEQGGLATWHTQRTAKSLRRMAQALAQHRQPDSAYRGDAADWPALSGRIQSGAVMLQPPPALFQHWAAQGVLCLNLGLTLSRFDAPVQAAHMGLWTPLLRRLLQHLCQRPGRTLQLLLWGDKVQKAWSRMGLQTDGTGVQVLPAAHPAAAGPKGRYGAAPFLDPARNPFDAATQAAQIAGWTTIDW